MGGLIGYKLEGPLDLRHSVFESLKSWSHLSFRTPDNREMVSTNLAAIK